MSEQTSPRQSSTRLIIASIASYNVGILLLWLQPMIVAELIDKQHLPSSAAGTVITAAMLMESLILLMSTKWRKQIFYRPTALFAALLTLAAGVGCLFANGLVAFSILLVLSAIGFGLLMLISSLGPSSGPHPERVFGQMYSINLVLSSGLLFLGPQISALFGGHPPAFPTLIIFALISLPFIALMPKTAGAPARPRDAAEAGPADGNARAIRWLAIGVAAIGLAYGQVWAFLAVLGTKAGLTADQTSSASALSLIGALAGSMLAGRMSAIFGGKILLRLSVVGISSCLLVVIFAPVPTVFFAGAIAAMFFMYLFFPTVLGAAAACDPSGHGVAIINGALALLAAAGPMVAGVLITVSGISALSIVTVVSAAIAMFAFVAAWSGSGAHNQTA